MIRRWPFKVAMPVMAMLCISTFTFAQNSNFILENDPAQRVQIAPESISKSFSEAGMKPVDHPLTSREKEKVEEAFTHLPPLHQRILKQHLHSISFMDDMSNTALTSPVDTGATKTFNITVRASLLNENISQWATWKENTCFSQEAGSGYDVRVEAGKLDAIIYVLLHEATHNVDAVLDITPHPAEANAIVPSTPFTKDIWRMMNVLAQTYTDSLLEHTRFRSGKLVAISRATEIYARLAKTPFPSLYAMAAWFEDIAELATIYHLASKMKQPFYIVVTKDNVELARFEPMNNALVTPRLPQLSAFYNP